MAAYDSYMPTKHEAASLAAQMMAQAHAPVGRIGPWLRRGAAVAAGLIVVIGSFALGQASVEPKVVDRVEVRTIYNVAYLDNAGVQRVAEFDSEEKRDMAVEKLENKGFEVLQLAESTTAGLLLICRFLYGGFVNACGEYDF